jgi:hypothetical protein
LTFFFLNQALDVKLEARPTPLLKRKSMKAHPGVLSGRASRSLKARHFFIAISQLLMVGCGLRKARNAE